MIFCVYSQENNNSSKAGPFFVHALTMQQLKWKPGDLIRISV